MASIFDRSNKSDQVILDHAIMDIKEAEAWLTRAHNRLKKIRNWKATDLNNKILDLQNIREVLEEEQ
jgi:hypothetical protein